MKINWQKKDSFISFTYLKNFHYFIYLGGVYVKLPPVECKSNSEKYNSFNLTLSNLQQVEEDDLVQPINSEDLELFVKNNS